MGKTTWSAKNRDNDITYAINHEFDIIIIGGGITGAGVAREAALRGLTFCLLDKNDFAFGTSSRSSKLAHGGMRYLASAEFKLVRESTTERNWLRNHFPNLVRPLGFYICSYKKGKNTPLKVRLGLFLYDLLSNWSSKYKNYRKGRIFKPEFIEEFEPAITQNSPELGKLKMAGFYYDTNIDDARLTIETIKESISYSHGKSLAINYSEVSGFTYDKSGKINGVIVKEGLNNKTFEVKGKTTVGCCGIWEDEIINKTKSTSKKVYPTKGVHVIVPQERVGNNMGFGIRSLDDGRVFFVLRRRNITLIGTTDTDYYKESKNLDEPWCTKKDCDYLFSTVNKLFPQARLTYDDIIGTYAGIRPLIKDENAKDESAVSRKHEIFETKDGLVTIVGGKLTTFRLMAEELLYYLIKKNYIEKFTNQKHMKKGFSKIPFKVGIKEDEFYSIVNSKKLYKTSFPGQMEYLFLQYGKQGIEILENIKKRPALGKSILDDYPHCEAEIQFILENENAPRLIDILCRRTEAQWTIWHYKQKELAEKIASIMSKYYRWSPSRKKSEINDYLKYIKKTIWF